MTISTSEDLGLGDLRLNTLKLAVQLKHEDETLGYIHLSPITEEFCHRHRGILSNASLCHLNFSQKRNVQPLTIGAN